VQITPARRSLTRNLSRQGTQRASSVIPSEESSIMRLGALTFRFAAIFSFRFENRADFRKNSNARLEIVQRARSHSTALARFAFYIAIILINSNLGLYCTVLIILPGINILFLRYALLDEIFVTLILNLSKRKMRVCEVT